MIRGNSDASRGSTIAVSGPNSLLAIKYLIARRLFGPVTAIVLPLLASLLPLIIVAGWKGGSDYQSAMASPLLLGVIAASSSASPSRYRLYALFGGMSLT